MALEEVIKLSYKSQDVKRFMQDINLFEDYNDPLYEVIHQNHVGGSRAHAELILPMLKPDGPDDQI
jgi:hypothetical protein